MPHFLLVVWAWAWAAMMIALTSSVIVVAGSVGKVEAEIGVEV
jgi:hypothetical protein